MRPYHDLDLSRGETTYRPALALLGAMASGIICDRVCDPGWQFWISGVVLGLLGWWAVGLAIARDSGQPNSIASSSRFRMSREHIGILCVGFAVLAAGGWRHSWYWNQYPDTEIGLIAESYRTPVGLRGVVSSEPRRWEVRPGDPLVGGRPRPRYWVLLNVQECREGLEWRPASGAVRMIVQGTEPIAAGSFVEVWGKLVAPTPDRNPGEFNFAWYSRAQHCLAIVSCAEDNVQVKRAAPPGWLGLRSRWRSHLQELIDRRLSEPQAALAIAVLLGNREPLGNEERQEFLVTGTAHVLAISGLHVGLLAYGMAGLLRLTGLRRGVRLWLIIGFALGYAWLVEFRAPVTRAALLISLYCLSRYFGRTGFSLNALALAGLAVLLVNPTDLFGVGPQLSFLAVFTMSVVGVRGFETREPWQQLIESSRPGFVRYLRFAGRNLAASWKLCAVLTLASAPAIAHYFHLVSPIGLLVNPLVMPPMALALFGGLGLMLSADWLPWGAAWGGWFCQVNLGIIQQLIDWGSEIPGGHWWTAGPSRISIAIFYFVFVGRGLTDTRFWNFRRLLVWFTIWWGGIWWGPTAIERWWARQPSEAWEITVIDVGHGTSVLMQMPGGERLLFDAGSFGSVEAGQRQISAALWDAGFEHLDGLFISHADVDHFNAVPELLKRFSFGYFGISPNIRESADPSARVLCEVFRERECRLHELVAGQEFNLRGGAKIRVLAPAPFLRIGSDNAQSLVLEVEALGRRLLLPADIEGLGLDLLLAQNRAAYDVVLAPHHGSLGSAPEAFVNWSQPRLVVVSGMTNRISPESRTALASVGATVVTTGELGAIRIRFTRDQLRWQSWWRAGRSPSQGTWRDDWQEGSGRIESKGTRGYVAPT